MQSWVQYISSKIGTYVLRTYETTAGTWGGHANKSPSTHVPPLANNSLVDIYTFAQPTRCGSSSVLVYTGHARVFVWASRHGWNLQESGSR